MNVNTKRVTLKAANEGGAAHLERLAYAVKAFAANPSAGNYLVLELAMQTYQNAYQDAYHARAERMAKGK